MLQSIHPIVLNSLILKDSFIYTRVTNSSQFNNSYNFSIPPGAKIDLYEDDIFKEKMEVKEIHDKSYFVSTFKAIGGKKYTLKAGASNMNNAEGSDIVPSMPSLHGLDFTETGNTFKVKIVLNDKVNEMNYYRLRVFNANENDMNQIVVGKHTYPFTIDNVDLNGTGIFGTIGERESYFSDEQFNGKDITLTLMMDYYPLRD